MHWPLKQFPCNEQLLGHILLLQSNPVYPLIQLHWPFTHVPWSEQKFGQSFCEHETPLYPCSQTQTPLPTKCVIPAALQAVTTIITKCSVPLQLAIPQLAWVLWHVLPCWIQSWQHTLPMVVGVPSSVLLVTQMHWFTRMKLWWLASLVAVATSWPAFQFCNRKLVKYRKVFVQKGGR